MATQELSYTQLTGHLLDWQNTLTRHRKPLNLGLKAGSTSEERFSNIIHPTGGPVLGFLYVKLASGKLTVEIAIEEDDDIADSDFDTPDFTSGSIEDTAAHWIPFATTALKPYFQVKTIGGNVAPVVAEAGGFVFGQFPLHGGYHELSAGFNAFKGAGGLISFALPADPA